MGGRVQTSCSARVLPALATPDIQSCPGSQGSCCPGCPQPLKRLSLGGATPDHPPSLPPETFDGRGWVQGISFIVPLRGYWPRAGVWVGEGWRGQRCLRPQTGDTNSPTSALSSCFSLCPQSPPDHCYKMDSSLAGTPSLQVSGSWFPHPPPGGGSLLPKAEEIPRSPSQPVGGPRTGGAHRDHCEPTELGRLQGKERRDLGKGFKK